MKTTITTLLASALCAVLALSFSLVGASEVTGTLSSGINATSTGSTGSISGTVDDGSSSVNNDDDDNGGSGSRRGGSRRDTDDDDDGDVLGANTDGDVLGANTFPGFPNTGRAGN